MASDQMRQLINVLIALAALAFVTGTVARFLVNGPWLGHEPVVYWRGSVGLLAFAMTLLLIQIRDR